MFRNAENQTGSGNPFSAATLKNFPWSVVVFWARPRVNKYKVTVYLTCSTVLGEQMKHTSRTKRGLALGT